MKKCVENMKKYEGNMYEISLGLWDLEKFEDLPYIIQKMRMKQTQNF